MMFGKHSDITLRKHLEEELLRARKLESLGVLAGGISGTCQLDSRPAHPEPVEGRGNDRIGSFAIPQCFGNLSF